MEDKKDKILSKCNIVPVKTMVKYLRDGMITMEELRSNGLTSEREEEINKEMISSEAVIWKKATNCIHRRHIMNISLYSQKERMQMQQKMA